MIPWQEFLNLLEGESVHLTAAKTHYAREILNTDDVPIFSTSIAPIMFAGKSANIEGENAMMEEWWRRDGGSSSYLFRFHCLNRKMSRAAQDASLNLCQWELMCKALSQLLSPF